jgi:hypothetical protein
LFFCLRDIFYFYLPKSFSSFILSFATSDNFAWHYQSIFMPQIQPQPNSVRGLVVQKRFRHRDGRSVEIVRYLAVRCRNKTLLMQFEYHSRNTVKILYERLQHVYTAFTQLHGSGTGKTLKLCVARLRYHYREKRNITLDCKG